MGRSISIFFYQAMSSILSSALVHNKLRPPLCRLLGYEIGDNTLIHPGVIFFNDGRKPNITIGSKCVIGWGVHLDATGGITVSDRVHIGPYTKLVTGTHNIQPSVYRRDKCELIAQPISIERGCWLGYSVVVLPGVTIREGCVVAAGSLVTKSTEPNGLYAGVPAVRKKDLPIETEMAFHNGIEVEP